jgi:hypothetical protein
VPFLGPILVFIIGLIAWLVDWPGDNLDYVLMWVGVVCCLAALLWAILIATGYSRRV